MRDGFIVWAHGPFPCGAHTDLLIFQRRLQHHLRPGERALTDKGCKSNRRKWRLNGASPRFASLVRARHETVNRRLKQFRVLGSRYKRSLRKRAFCFHAVANLTQLMMENGEPLFEI